jgi:hypothetical protein
MTIKNCPDQSVVASGSPVKSCHPEDAAYKLGLVCAIVLILLTTL